MFIFLLNTTESATLGLLWHNSNCVTCKLLCDRSKQNGNAGLSDFGVTLNLYRILPNLCVMISPVIYVGVDIDVDWIILMV
jgi:hypothetical protein